VNYLETAIGLRFTDSCKMMNFLNHSSLVGIIFGKAKSSKNISMQWRKDSNAFLPKDE
tara:strand:+ start:307 stop:480 length:174 start_codon:yes stop_codon:yes gene_type:complete